MANATPTFRDVVTLGATFDLHLPDSPLVGSAYSQALDSSEPWLFNHVVRSWLYSAKLAQVRSLSPDSELLAVSVLLHDLGLAQGGATDRRFEVLGADLGRKFALDQGLDPTRAEILWDAIALHTTASIAQYKGADVACCQFGISCDYGGLGYNELPDNYKKAVIEAYPRLHMKQALTSCLCGIAESHPATTLDNFVRDFGERFVSNYTTLSFVDVLTQSPFSE